MPRIDLRGSQYDHILKNIVREIATDELDLTATGTKYLYQFQEDARVTRVTLIMQTSAASTYGVFQVGTDSDPAHFVVDVTLTDAYDAGDAFDLTLASKDISADDILTVTTTGDNAATGRFIVEFVEDVGI